MNSLVRGDGRFPVKALAMAMGIWVLSGSSGRSDDVAPADPGPPVHDGAGFGTLGWAPFGYYPGFQGFALKFHPGYGYGGDALGVGALGGYPFYGGPGYLHPAPPLRRFGSIIPFAFYAGPGYPFNFEQPAGPLVVTPPVVTQTGAEDAAHAAGSPVYPYDVGFGPFTGAFAYPESFFAPYTAAAAAVGSTTGAVNPAPSGSANAYRVGALGIDEELVVDSAGLREMKVSRVYPESPAEKAGLKVGDVIRSINSYRTAQPGNIVWIILNAAPDKVLKINVRTAADGKEHTITAELP